MADDNDDLQKLGAAQEASNVTSMLDRRARRPRTPAVGQQPDRASEHRRAGKLTAAQKRNKVLALRAAGGTEEQIAQVMREQGYSITRKGVNAIITRALEDMQLEDQSAIESVRALQLDRLDRMLAKVWPKVLDGNLKAIKEAREIERLRAKIAGTEAPRKVQHSGTVDHRVSREEVDALSAAWQEHAIDGTAVEIPALETG